MVRIIIFVTKSCLGQEYSSQLCQSLILGSYASCGLRIPFGDLFHGEGHVHNTQLLEQWSFGIEPCPSQHHPSLMCQILEPSSYPNPRTKYLLKRPISQFKSAYMDFLEFVAECLRPRIYNRGLQFLISKYVFKHNFLLHMPNLLQYSVCF